MIFTTILFKGALVFVSQDFINYNGLYPQVNARDAQAYVQQYNSVLPTPELVDAIYQSATCIIVTPPADPTLLSSSTIHDKSIAKQKAQCSDLNIIDGHKKTIVQSKKPNRLAIYGWFTRKGKRIQPYSMIHTLDYKDYSHGVRLIYRWALKDGRLVPIEDLLSKTD